MIRNPVLLASKTGPYICTSSYGRISSSWAPSLYRVDDPSYPIPEEIGYVSNRFWVRHKVPTSGRILVIIEPTAENKVCGDTHEGTAKELC